MPTSESQSIRPIDQASRQMIREALTGGFDRENLGDYAKDAALGGVSGAWAGLPGAAIGAASSVGMHGIQDLRYHLMDNKGQATWQASDLKDRLGEIASLV